MSKGVHNIAFYVSPDPECSRTTQDSEISLAPSRGRILYAIYGNSTCVINHIVVTAIDKRYRNYYVSTAFFHHTISASSTPTDGPPMMTIRLSSCGSPELVSILVSSAEMSQYSFFSWAEKALIFDSSRARL